MTLQEKIEKAFAHRSMPASAVDLEGCIQFDSDVEDAMWFTGRDWRSLTTEDWKARYSAVFFLSPEAFQYFLPSLLILTLHNPQNFPDLAVEAVIQQLDRSTSVAGWNDHFKERFLGWHIEEYEATKEWLVWASENIPDMFYGMARNGPGDGYGRVFDSIELLRQETELRKMIAREEGRGDDSAAQ